MLEQIGGAAELQKAYAVPADSPSYLPPTRRQQLEKKKALLEMQLEIIKKGIAALDAHPDLEEFAETLARALY